MNTGWVSLFERISRMIFKTGRPLTKHIRGVENPPLANTNFYFTFQHPRFWKKIKTVGVRVAVSAPVELNLRSSRKMYRGPVSRYLITRKTRPAWIGLQKGGDGVIFSPVKLAFLNWYENLWLSSAIGKFVFPSGNSVFIFYRESNGLWLRV